MMTTKNTGGFPSAAQDKAVCGVTEDSNSAYRLAYDDVNFLMRDELRAIRLQLEWLKPDLVQDDFGIESTVAIFGSARSRSPKKNVQCTSLLPENHSSQSAKPTRVVDDEHYYQVARSIAKKVTELSKTYDNKQFVIVTGGGPGLMQAANQGAAEAGGISIGLNIVLPFEQSLNPYVTPELGFQFHYFAIRKMHFLKRAKALIACPGGFGTLDELFETLTLIQTKKVNPLPVILVGKSFWQSAINFDFLAQQGVISEQDLSLFHLVDTAEEAWDVLTREWRL